jgi:hypothetical protein
LRSVLFSEKSGGERVEKQRLMRFARQHVKRPKYSHQLWRVLALDLESNMVAVALWETQRQNYFTGGWRDRHNCAGSHGFDGPSAPVDDPRGKTVGIKLALTKGLSYRSSVVCFSKVG